ncbi:hypothetical protein E2C01_056904 [Portunus trituberculatus]|uniref:Uncharacterized protein n=1 Tax=Portunus trituberculatus TaxID=210409 RepID=A0A5B7H1W4_PORTR|nr:hypothetical protein [Portunus trituberculatus]
MLQWTLSRYPGLCSPSMDAHADLNEDLVETVTAAVIAQNHILDESVMRKFTTNDQLLLAKVLAVE